MGYCSIPATRAVLYPRQWLVKQGGHLLVYPTHPINVLWDFSQVRKLAIEEHLRCLTEENSSTSFSHAALRCPVAESDCADCADCADGQMEQSKEQTNYHDLCIHFAMIYIECCLSSVSNSSPHHHVSNTKMISFNYTTVCKTFIFPAIHTWTTSAVCNVITNKFVSGFFQCLDDVR